MSEIRLAVIEEQMDELAIRASAAEKALGELAQQVFAQAPASRTRFDEALHHRGHGDAALAHRVDRDRLTRKFQDAMSASREAAACEDRLERLSKRLTDLERAVNARSL